MYFTEFTIRILFLFLPGIITYLIIESLTVIKERKVFYFIIYSFVLGFIAYFTFYLVLLLSTVFYDFCIESKFKFFKALLDPKVSLDITEIFFVSIIAIINGFILSYMINRKSLHRTAQSLRITKKFAEIDVWDLLFNSSDDEMKWVLIRDIKNDLIYEGWIEAFSDTVKENELFIRDVIVYQNSTDQELYKVPGLYLARNRDEITIEFPALPFSNGSMSSHTNQKEGVS
ncbi:hypothetical protein ISS37_07190 [candidate division KSB1 bacterium]|nr:hypothetical protein [candidate division KSB1 bacterium]